MTRRKGHPPAFRRLMEEAKRNAAGSPPRKHHLVPGSYLQRWAEPDGKGRSEVRVTEVDEHRSYCVAPKKAARETDFYRLEHPDIDPDTLPPLLFETYLSKIEGHAVQAIDGLIRHGDTRELGAETFVLFAMYLGLTATRGREFRTRAHQILTDGYKLLYADVSDKTIVQKLRDHGMEPTDELIAQHRAFLDGLQTGEIVARIEDAQLVLQSAEMAEDVAERFVHREWLVYETPPILVTCDEPVVRVAGPGAPRGERSGVESSGAVLFPLDPSHLLVMFHPDMAPRGPLVLDHTETAEINQEIIAGSTRWAFERPRRKVAERLTVPPLPPEAMKTEGPLAQVEGAKGDLYRQYAPTRWQDDPHAPPWPVARWWPGWSAHQYPSLANLGHNGRVAYNPEPEPWRPPRKKKRRRR
ncbi:DUF4238 domain-containing protein [Nocardia takedensis]|uniref:DUF4238 domain-containing protein n=1 Tax=Nocardia takedensis TaxID=259390 RepID=UPI0009FF68DA|nr:DUF4238 domain-containing protein [Nocardia takedensis]